LDLEDRKKDHVMSKPKLTKHASQILSSKISRRAFARGAAGLATCIAGVSVSPIPFLRAAELKGSRPYKIGLVAPLTGPFAPEGLSMQRGFDLGVEAINAAGGIGGYKVEAITQDTQSTPAVCGTVVKKFIQEEKVDLIIGTITIDEEVVASQVAATANVPVLFPEGGFFRAYCNTTGVLLGETSYDWVVPLVPFMAEKFGKKFLLVATDITFSHAYQNIAKENITKIGGTIVDEIYAPPGTADFSSTIAKIKSAKPDVIFSCVVGGDAITFVKQAQSLGLLPGANLTGITLQPEFYPAMGEAVDGLYACMRYSEEIDTSGNKVFKAAFRSKYGDGPIPMVATTAYYSLDFVKAAVEKAGTYDRKSVFNAFKGLQAKTMLSDEPLTINPETMNVRYPMYITQIQKGGLYKIVKDAGFTKYELKCN
jgi:ABC-type branched-subunit amino acid transport system substrate-binding protein